MKVMMKVVKVNKANSRPINLFIIVVLCLSLISFNWSLENDKETEPEKNIHILFSKKKYEYSRLFNLLDEKFKPLENRDCIAFEFGYDKVYLINKYVKGQKEFIIDGEDYLSFHSSFYKFFLDRLNPIWEDSLPNITNISVEQTDIRQSFGILKELVKIDNYSATNQHLIDSLNRTSFRYSQKYLIKTTDYFITELNSNNRISSFFGSNKDIAKQILHNIELKKKQLDNDDLKSEIQKKYFLDVINRHDNTFISNPSLELLSYLKGSNVKIYLSPDVRCRKRKNITKMAKDNNFTIIDIRLDN